MLIGKPTRSAEKFDQFWFMFLDGVDFEMSKWLLELALLESALLKLALLKLALLKLALLKLALLAQKTAFRL
jgi:hypothetical protein